MQIAESNTVIIARGVLGVAASILLTAGATLGVAAELQRGFAPVFQGMQERQSTALPRAKPAPTPESLRPTASAKAPSARALEG